MQITDHNTPSFANQSQFGQRTQCPRNDSSDSAISMSMSEGPSDLARKRPRNDSLNSPSSVSWTPSEMARKRQEISHKKPLIPVVPFKYLSAIADALHSLKQALQKFEEDITY